MGSKSQTKGFKYFVGMHMILCHSGVDTLTRIRVGDKIAWEGASTGGGVEIDEPELFGGEDKEGGVKGWLDFELGHPAQAKNIYLREKIERVGGGFLTEEERVLNFLLTLFGGNSGWVRGAIGAEPVEGAEYKSRIPHYRGVVGIVLNQMYIGMNPYLKPWKFTIKATDYDSRGNELWYKEKSRVGDYDLNAIHIIYMALTNPDWGLNMLESELDQENFRAAADVVYTEGIGLSFLINDEGSIEEFITDVLSHINASFRVDRSTGLMQIKLIREDYDAIDLELFDTTKIRKIKNYQRTSISDLVNTVLIKFWDRELGEVSTYKIQDLAAVSIQGAIVEKTIEYTGITNIALASMVGARDLAALSSPLITCDLITNRYGAKYGVGDVIVVDWPQYEIESVIFRIIKIVEPKFGSGNFTITVMEDVFGVNEAIYTNPRPDLVIGSSVVSPLLIQHIAEAPYALLAAGLSEADLNTLDYGEGIILGLGASSSVNEYGFKLQSVLGGDVSKSELTTFTPFARIVPSLDRETKLVALVYSDPDTVDYTGIGLIDNEFIEITGYDAQNNAIITRGAFDTFPELHDVNAVVWLIEVGDAAIIPKIYLLGEAPSVTPITTSPSGVLASDKAITEVITINSRASRPYPTSNVKLDGAYWPDDITGSGTFDVTWQPRDRVTTREVPIDWFLDSGSPPAGMTYNIRFYDTTNDSLIEESTGMTALTYAATANAGSVRIELETQVNGITSEVFTHTFTRLDISGGYGTDFGNDYGGT